MGKSKSENVANNPSENFADNDRRISPPITSQIRGSTFGIDYNPVEPPISIFAPNGLIFTTDGLSNGYYVGVNGITDFTAYNDYIHYDTSFAVTRGNVYSNLVRASFRFEIYSRQYRI